MLTPRDVVPYLLDRRLIDRETVVRGDVRVIDSSRRNCNFKVIRQRGPSYFLKQGVGVDGPGSVAHEAKVYKELHSPSGGVDFSDYLPSSLDYDPEARIFIMELIAEAENLREFHARCRRISLRIASAMGHALARLHRLPFTAASSPGTITGSEATPRVLSIHDLDLDTYRHVSLGNLQMIGIIQSAPEFGSLLDDLRQAWQPSTLIHRDLRWDNWLVYRPPDTAGRFRLKLIDWEIAGIGDPCWDIGSVFNDFLACWLLSIPITSSPPDAEFVQLARFPLSGMKPAMRAFWQSYTAHMELDHSTARDRLVRSVRFAAARLIQTAFEEMFMSYQLNGNIICLLQLSLNMLQRPREAIVSLLGLALDE